MQGAYPAINIKFTDRKLYYDAFDSFYRDNDVGAMIELIAAYVEELLDLYLSCVKTI